MVSLRGWNLLLNRPNERVHVELVLGRDGYYWRILRYGSFGEILDLVVVRFRSLPVHDVYFVLNQDHVAKSYHLGGEHMLPVLSLRSLDVGRDDEHRAVHYGRAREHRYHQTMMTGTINETHRSQKLGRTVTVWTCLARRIVGWWLAGRALVE